MSKLKIYLDCDDTILNSSETVIDILNNRYGINKNIEDLKDWYYRSIVKNILPEQIIEIYSSDEFWSRVKFKQSFLDFYNKYRNKFEWYIVTKGDSVNLEKKKKFLDGKLKKYYYIPLDFEDTNEFCKHMIDMEGGIQVDDRRDCLVDTNAACKILITNNRERYWNKSVINADNFYRVSDWEEIQQILLFFNDNKKLVKECY